MANGGTIRVISLNSILLVVLLKPSKSAVIIISVTSVTGLDSPKIVVAKVSPSNADEESVQVTSGNKPLLKTI